MKQLILTVAPDGNTTLETQGFAGRACQEASKNFEDALFANAKSQPTAEMYRKAEQHVRNHS